MASALENFNKHKARAQSCPRPKHLPGNYVENCKNNCRKWRKLFYGSKYNHPHLLSLTFYYFPIEFQ